MLHYDICDICDSRSHAYSLNTGKFVSESKFRAHPADFIPHILNPNRPALEALITKPAVEKALLERLVKKARIYGRDIGPDGEPREDGWKIDVQTVHDLYEKYIIPLTKEVEVRCQCTSS